MPVPAPSVPCSFAFSRAVVFGRFAIVLAALVAFSAPRSARASDDDDAHPRHVRQVKRRAALGTFAGRDRVGTSAREPAVSVGSPNQGHLENGAHLDTSKYIHVVTAYERGDVRWGHPSLTHMIERGARAVAKRWPGSALDVGDLSRKNGGDLWRHHSHESGRDADVGFYVSDAKGKPLHAPHFVRFDGALRAMNFAGAHLDEARTWAFVQTILTDPAAHVSHIFVAEPIRQRLLAYARAHGVSGALWTRAATTMMQPSDSEAHDDHMHVRISCPSSNRGTCLEIARRPVRHPAIVAHKTPMRPSVLRTPPRASSTPAVVVRKDPQLYRSDERVDDLGPLARARSLP